MEEKLSGSSGLQKNQRSGRVHLMSVLSAVPFIFALRSKLALQTLIDTSAACRDTHLSRAQVEAES